MVHVNVLQVRIKYAKKTRNNWPKAKKYSITIPVNKRLLGPTKIHIGIRFFRNKSYFLPISEPSTKPETDIPRVEQASKNRAKINIRYDGQKPNDACGPKAHKNPANVIRIKLTLIIGRRPYLNQRWFLWKTKRNKNILVS